MPIEEFPSTRLIGQRVTPVRRGRATSAPDSAELDIFRRARNGDLVAFGQIYQTLFANLYDFVARVTRSQLTADRISREAISHAVAELAQVASARDLTIRLRAVAMQLIDRPGPVPTGDGRLDQAASGSESRFSSLVWEGTALLGPKTYAVLDLAVRSELADAEVGAIMGLRGDIASETIARTRKRAEHAISIFVLVKSRVAQCSGLRGVVGAHADDSLSVDLADVVADHLETCEQCHLAWEQLPSPAEVLRSLAPVTPRPGLRDSVWAQIRRQYRWSGPGSTTRRIQTGSVAAAIAVIMSIVAVVNIGGGGAEASVEVSAVEREASRMAGLEPVTAAVAETTTTTIQPSTTSSAAQVAPVTVAPTSTVPSPSEPPILGIITPRHGQQFVTSTGLVFVELVAVVQDDNDEALVVDWHEGTVYLGTGRQLTVTFLGLCPASETRTISARATDSSGNTTVETVAFVVRCDGEAE